MCNAAYGEFAHTAVCRTNPMKQPVASFFLVLALLTSISGCDQGIEPLMPDEQFVKLLFRYGFGDTLDTFNRTYTKDLILDGSITVPFWLTKAEQDSVLTQLEQADFFNLPDTIPSLQGVVVQPDPGLQLLRVQLEGRVKTVVWFPPIDQELKAGQRILRLFKSIETIIQAKPEYKELPPARGGYL